MCSLCEVELAGAVGGAGGEAVSERGFARGGQASVGQLHRVAGHVHPLVDKVHGSGHLYLLCRENNTVLSASQAVTRPGPWYVKTYWETCLHSKPLRNDMRLVRLRFFFRTSSSKCVQYVLDTKYNPKTGTFCKKKNR